MVALWACQRAGECLCFHGRVRLTRIVPVLALVTIAAGCTGTDDGTADPVGAPAQIAAGGPTPSLSPQERYAVDHGVEIPDVPVVREIRPDESVTVIAQCMEEAGWPSEIDAEGAASYDIPPGQGAAYDEASVRCRFQYPIAEKYTRPFTAEQWGVLYDHWATTTIPCLRDQGYDPAELPTRETFIEESLGGGADYVLNGPIYDDVMADVAQGRWPSERHLLTNVCPQEPPEDVLYGAS